MTSRTANAWRTLGVAALAWVCLATDVGSQVVLHRTQWYDHPYDQVWETTLSVIQRGGWPLVRAERGKGMIRTGWYEFAEGTYGPSVAIKPPRLTWEYGFYHKVALDTGRSRLKLSLVPSKGGTRVAIYADVQEYSFHRDLLKYMWAHRESNGAIELFFLQRVAELLEGNPAEPDTTDAGAPEASPRVQEAD